jgi:ATP-dependent Clp protease ATP-binding subunit ClpC
MFERYTEPARRVLRLARDQARELGSSFIETEHLLLGVIRVADDLTSRIFVDASLSVDAVRNEMAPPKHPVPSSVTNAEPPFSGETKRVLQYTAEEADRLLHTFHLQGRPYNDHIGPEHQLLGLLREHTACAASILVRHGVTLDIARDWIARQSN